MLGAPERQKSNTSSTTIHTYLDDVLKKIPDLKKELEFIKFNNDTIIRNTNIVKADKAFLVQKLPPRNRSRPLCRALYFS